MDTPTSREGRETVAAALELGLGLIDTAREYAGSEHLIGDVIRAMGRRDAYLATKTFSRTADGCQWDVDRSLRALGVDVIDLYQLHDVSRPEVLAQVLAEGGALEGLRTAQYRGLVRHVGVSCHSLEVARDAVVSGEFDAIMLEYSAFYPDSAPIIALAAERDVAVIVMRPLGGSGRTSVIRGRVADGTAGVLTPANLLRYVLSNPAVSVAIPGARYPSRVHENLETSASFEPMDEGMRAELEAAAQGLY